jgi:tRNA (mo5U34)-methyltransferase
MTLQSNTNRDPEIARLAPWFHNLHLPDGRQTAPDHPLGDFPSFKWKELGPQIPADLTGWTALDIGCNAGYYSFQLARRGAQVTGLEPDAHYLAQARWAAERLELSGRVEFRQGTVYDLARTPERWDLVLFMGVLYHLRHPLLALDAVAGVVGRMLVLQTLTVPGEERVDAPPNLSIDARELLRERGWPMMAFLEHELADDETNWWAPNSAGVEAMARSAGLEVVDHPAHEIWICRPRTPFPHAEELAAASGAPRDGERRAGSPPADVPQVVP